MAEQSNLPVPVVQAGLPIAPGETSSSAIAAREKAAVEARFMMALHRPRVFEVARLRLLDACKRPKFAATARYAKPVGGKKVYGLSIRFAEEARVLWGNMDITALLVFDDDEKRIYRVQGTDLETNATDGVDLMIEKFVERRVVREGMEVVGRRTNTEGEVVYKIRATEDDLLVKVNNMIAKSRRNVILTLLPSDIKEECDKQIIETVGKRDKEDPAGARKDILDAFWTLGVTPEQISGLLAKPLEQINPAELTMLRSYYTALRDGETTWNEIVESHGGTAAKAPAASRPGAAGLNEALKKNQPTDTNLKPGRVQDALTHNAETDEEIAQQDAALARRDKEQEEMRAAERAAKK